MVRCNGCQYRHELAAKRDYARKHKDKMQASMERWRKENPDKAAEISRLSARKAYYCVNEVICVLQIEERYVMLNEVKHLNAKSMRCFAALNMTMNTKKLS